MLHHKSFRKFGRERNQRIAFIKSLALALVLNGKIETTEARAKEIRPFVEKLVTRGKVDTLAARRLVLTKIGGPDAVKMIFETIAPKYKERNGGYLRITKLPTRGHDAAKMAQIEFV